MNYDHADVTAGLAAFQGLYPEKIALSLDRIMHLLDAMGRPQDRLPPVIHVAGTNGKGSTCAYLRAMAEAEGLTVHVFTSPHLVRFNERIRLAGKLIDDQRLIDWLARTRAALGDHQITHFEATTAMALLAFSEVPADLLILEVGLGGRYDATNVIETPALSVITPIDFDHKQFLGTDLAGIAAEKAGIIKPNCPVASAPQSRVSAEVIASTAAENGSDLQTLSIEDIELVPEYVALAGTHQRYNAALAGLALRMVFGSQISSAAIWNGAKSASWPARLQRLQPGPLTDIVGGIPVWLDGGHNPHAGGAISDVLRQMGGTTVMVSAMMASKDHGEFFRTFEGVVEDVHTVPNAQGHHGADPAALAQAAALYLPRATAHHSLQEGLKAAAVTGPSQILICGSLYLAGDVLAMNDEYPA